MTGKDDANQAATGADPKAEVGAAPDKDAEPAMTFDGESVEILRKCYREARWILEYGSGGSTLFAARETQARVLSIESDVNWARKMRRHLAASGRRPDVEVRWVDIGPTGKWGYPEGQGNWWKYFNYPLSPWTDAGLEPDLVLVDGRFRRACVAAAMLHCRKPLRLIIDDYATRPSYHAVERFIPLTERAGRMAVFEVVPRQLDNRAFAELLPWFFDLE